MAIKKGDSVIVIAGADKGKTGTVTRVLPAKGKAVVEGINVRKKHQRARRGGQKGQTVERALPIHISNMKLAEGKAKKTTSKKKDAAVK